MAVVDASVIFEFLTLGDRGGAVAERLLGSQRALWAPELLDAEVGSALRRAVRHRDIEAGKAAEALGELKMLPIHRVSHEGLAQFAWLLRDNISFYDGLYVALAQLLEKPLLTLDAALAQAPVDVEIELLAQA
jgi:predicted nucleic acid-binding protein